MTTPIAIVGMSCVFPDARSPMELWENALAQRRAFRRMPAERMNLADYFSADPLAPDRTYSAQASVIEGYEFDRVAFRVVGSTYRSADLAHWLALDVASRALADAGFQNGEGLARNATGVVLGNTLTGEFSRANVLRLRWPYVQRVVDAALAGQGWAPEKRRAFFADLEVQYKAPFPPVGEETLAGGLSNTIAGRICNQFDLKGGGYTVDGACASSLLAVANACASLETGDLEVALAGGVDLSLDPFEIVGFSKTAALAPEEMRIYDARSAGFWPGEGCGFVVLMRAEDAIAQGRRIYAMIRGWGISSDGSGGITRPEMEGQLQALGRAYRRAGFGPETVSYFEGHGTGTNVGDATELRVLSQARRSGAIAQPSSSHPPAIIGSIKANIGHTKAAAGIAGLIKATMAVHTQLIPPTTGCQTPHAELGGEFPALRIAREGECWPPDRPLRAGVSAMGFGGINSHLVLESSASERRSGLTQRERFLLRSAQDAELFLFSAPTTKDLAEKVAQLLAFAANLSRAELADLAAQLAGSMAQGAVRAAVVASSPAELAERLAALKSLLSQGVTAHLSFHDGVFLGAGTSLPRLGFLFPGQGSPSRVDGGIFRRRFDCVKELYDQAQLPGQSDGIATQVAQPAICAASLAGLRLARELGLQATVAVGHSLGEITALHWAGAFDEAALLRIARARGAAMAALGSPTGRMTAITASANEVKAMLNGDPVSIVGFNSPRQTVVAGDAAAVANFAARLHTRGWRSVELPVSHAFHTPLVAAAAPALAQQLALESFGIPERTIISTVRGVALGREENLRELLCAQVTSPVRFIEAVTAASKMVDLFIEIGSGQVLAGLTAECIATPVVALDCGGPSLNGLLQAVGAAFALGAPINHAALFEGRFTRPFPLEWKPKFFTNPCELAPLSQSAFRDRPSDEPMLAAVRPPLAAEPAPCPQSPLELLRQLVAGRAELPVASVRAESRMLRDLHLNSISVGQLIAEAARRLQLSPVLGLTDFANMTVGQAAQALEELARIGASGVPDIASRAPAGVDGWVRPFAVNWVPAPLGRSGAPTAPPGRWQVFASPHHPLAEPLRERLAHQAGNGVVVCMPVSSDESCLNLLLQGARVALAAKESRFVLIQQPPSVASKTTSAHPGVGSFARSLHLEAPHVVSCVIDVPFYHAQAVEWIIQEISAARGHTDARYDETGARSEPQAALLPLTEPLDDWPVGPQDVLLVTGGGKGIAAECALSLARKTGVALMLMGRSKPSADADLATNLDRLRAAGARFRYVTADVTDADAVRAAVMEVERELGPVTAFLHAAGINEPKSIIDLDEAAFRRTLAPKVEGARNVLAALRPEQLRLFIAFGSIIGRAGLQGEADYAVANEWLTQLTEAWQTEHPHCRCLAVEWSVWSGLGMGARLGRVEALRQEGITPISPEAGVEMLERLLRSRVPAPAVIVMGRYGELPTLKLAKPELPFLRFLEQPRVHYPGVEFIADAVLSSESDPYLDEHVYHGERLFPAVMGLEAMAQAAMALMGSEDPPCFENVELARPVVAPRDRKTTIRVAALVRQPGIVEVALRAEETGFQADHFRATCRFEKGTDLLRNSRPNLKSEVSEFKSRRSPLEPARDLYDELLFHTGRFQRVMNYRLLRARECVVQLEPDTKSAWFGPYLPQDRVLGDSGVRDAAIHAIQACIPHARLLPVGVGRIVIGKIPCLMERLRALKGAIPELLLHAREVAREGDLFHYDLELLGEDGSVLEKWEGLRLRKVESIPRPGPWPAALLGPYLERRLEELCPAARVSVALGSGPDEGKVFHQLLGGDSTIRHRADGKPEVAGGQTLSVSHAGELTLGVTGAAPLGCDLEPLVSRTKETWRDLLGPEAFRLAELISQKEDFNIAATRVWTAIECLKKSGAPAGAPLTLQAELAEGWVLIRAGSGSVATLFARLRSGPEAAVFAVLTCGY